MNLTVVHVIRSAKFAGVERHVATLAAGQAEVGHRVVVIGGEEAAMRDATAGSGVKVRPSTTLVGTARWIDRFRAADILHVHMTAAEAAAVLAPRSWGVPVVSSRHFARRRGASWAGHVAAPVIPHRIHVEIAVSDYVARHIGAPSTVVHPGVAVAPGRVPAADRERSVLVVQRLEAEKRTDVAVRAFALSELAEQGWRLDVVGDGAQRGQLEALARRLEVMERVRFLGRRDDVGDLMGRAGIFLAPCPVEALGLAVLEAMAAGLPVVASGAGGHLETVGLVADAALFAPGSVADAAARLFALAGDLERREWYGAALQEVQRRHFTIDSQVRATDAVYRSVL